MYNIYMSTSDSLIRIKIPEYFYFDIKIKKKKKLKPLSFRLYRYIRHNWRRLQRLSIFGRIFNLVL